MQFCLFSSTPDMDGLGFVVKAFTGLPEELGQRAVEWGDEGIEFMPRVVDRIRTGGRLPTNVAFGLPGERRIYVTEVEFSQIEVIDVDSEGHPFYT